ncbi:MAG: mechanosensitive ion channel family protein [Vicinamibacterales bacterium]
MQYLADLSLRLQQLLPGTGLRIAIIAIAAYVLVRLGVSGTHRFEREMSQGTGLDVIERTKRVHTLGRLLRHTLTIAAAAIAGLMILREIGIDITPVLTGAGIVGLAVGFGAQTLVRDFISGFFLILEDQIRVGDVASINGQGGLVEEVNLRTIVLRDEQGAVHVFPNGEVKTLTNLTKDFSFYVFTVNIGFDEDPEPVIAAIQDTANALMQDRDYQPHVLEPVDVMGVDAYDRGTLVIKARIKTVPLKQWYVGRELRRRVARTFADRGIRFAVPETVTHIKGTAAPETDHRDTEAPRQD